MQKYTLILDDMLKIDISYACPYIPNQYIKFFFGGPGVAPYRFLSYFSTFFNHSTIIEIGTHNGWGSLALSHNRNNKIVGYDVDLSTLDKNISKIPNLTFKEGLAHELDPKIILNSPLIHFDALHDGVYEKIFYDFLITNNYKGFVIYDDIGRNKEMVDFWNSIKLLKYDLTYLGHETGTGLVSFGGIEIETIRRGF